MLKQYIKLDKNWKLCQVGKDKWFDIPSMPMQVHEILHLHHAIPDEFEIGLGEKIKWIAESDWRYSCDFSAPDMEGVEKAEITFFTIDTIADIFLNSVKILSCDSIYRPFNADVTKLLQKKNTLEIVFQSPYTYMAEHPMPEQWIGKIRHTKILRKPNGDFSDYLGARPYITPIGVAGDIVLELSGSSELLSWDADAKLTSDYKTGVVNVFAKIRSMDDASCQAYLLDADGKVISTCKMEYSPSKESDNDVRGKLTIDDPLLWWPRGFGSQPLYSVRIELKDTAGVTDTDEKKIGFRTVRMDNNFNCYINGKQVRLWGSNLPPLDGRTHCYNKERAHRLLDLVEMANMNFIRIWGEGEVFDDDLYDECDRRGVLVWQEFFNFYGMQPDTKEFIDACVKDAEYLIRRLRHHASIIMWCGGNEGLMGIEFDDPEDSKNEAMNIGAGIYTKEYAELCKKLDPDRLYYVNSPSGGAYTNDPRCGDMHGYEMWRYIPGAEYPVAITEQMRASAPALKSMKRFIPADKLWPADFVDSTTYGKRNQKLLPDAWMYRAGGMLAKKSGHVEHFYDAETPEELIYKYAAAHAEALKNGIERSRMGRPSGADCERISNCHLVWKLSDTWPLIYSSIIDYYLEPFIPYYEVKRGYSPVLVCFDIRDSINLWLVNDSAADVHGTLEFGIFNPAQNRFMKFEKIEAHMKSGCSGEIQNLDSLGEFPRDYILYACFTDSASGAKAENFNYVDIERNMIFPEAKLSIIYEGDELKITADSYARCIELSGSDNGDEFGWYFDDNYFDLLPGMVKTVKIYGKHRSGVISAKAHYSPNITKLNWEKKAMQPE